MLEVKQTMDTHGFDPVARRFAGLTTRRQALRAMTGGTLGLVIGGAAFSGAERVSAGRTSAMTDDPDDLDQAIARMRSATAEFINGNTGPWKAMCSQRDDATLFGGWGGYERGWEQLAPRYDWASARFAGGDVTFEEITRVATPDLAYTVHFERNQARLAGRDEIVQVDLRVSHVYRREEAGWKLVHRHADPIVAVQAPQSVVSASGTPPAS